jgi:glycosyltransferase involved in cell wall biosynthesis
MSVQQNIKIVQVFEKYPLFYQPYIPPVIEALKREQQITLHVNAFKGTADKDVEIIPSYYWRKIKEQFFALTTKYKPKLNYAEIKYLNQKVDIVHLQHSFLFPKIKGLLELPKSQRPNVIITLRGGDTYVKPWMSKKWRKFYIEDGGKVDAFITMSQHQKDYLHEKWGVAKNKIHVIPISFGAAKVIAPKHPNETVLKVVSVFRMCWEKNIDGNLRVIKELKDKGINVQYSLYGDGPDSGQVWYLIDKYQLSECVTYYGKVKNEVLKNQLPKYDFFLQLSLSEALPTSVIEAQSLGLPAIVSDSGGLPESILNEESGFCLPSYKTDIAANLMVALWSDKQKYRMFSEKAIEFSKTNFSVSNEVNKLLTLYAEVTN